MTLRVIFAGTPEFAAAHLQALIASEHQVVAVYTQPDRPSGRGKTLSPSPVKVLAEQHALPVFQPTSLKNPEEQQQLAALNADVMVVVAYGLLLPLAILQAPRFGCLNVHASLLPRWRGAAPIQRAIEAGDTESGVTIMQMDEGLDTGAMLYKSRCPISGDDTAGDLHDRLLTLGPPALLKVLTQLCEGSIQAEEQDETQTCYARKFSKQDAKIDWQQSAQQIQQKIRAFNPVPVCFTEIADKRLRIYKAEVLPKCESVPGEVVAVSYQGIDVACGENSAIRIQNVQLPGKKLMDIKEFLNGYAKLIEAGTALQ